MGRARTFVKNLVGTRRIQYIPPNGRVVNAGQTIIVPGILETELFLGKTQAFNQYVFDVDNNRVEITYDFDTTPGPGPGPGVGLSSDIVLSRENKGEIPLVTVGDNSPTGITITDPPVASSGIEVFLNGLASIVGDGDLLQEFYFSNDGGSSARDFASVQQGDELYFNGALVGFELAVSDKISLLYLTATASSSSSSSSSL